MRLPKTIINFKKTICILTLILCSFSLFCEDAQVQDSINEVQVNENVAKALVTETEIALNIDYPLNGYLSATEKLHLFTKKTHKEYLEFDFNLELSPVTLSSGFLIDFNYLDFFNLFYNFELASGWNYKAVGFYGLAENYNNENKREIQPYNFSKVLIKNTLGLKLLINLNFFLKNEWSDFSFATKQIFTDNELLPKKENEFWLYKNDSGENRNGFLYKGTYSLQYRPPLYLSSINLDFSTIKKLYKPISETKNIAESLWSFELNTALTFSAAKFMDIKIASLFASEYVYKTYNGNLHFTQKILNTDKPRKFRFKNISASFIFKIMN